MKRVNEVVAGCVANYKVSAQVDLYNKGKMNDRYCVLTTITQMTSFVVFFVISVTCYLDR